MKRSLRLLIPILAGASLLTSGVASAAPVDLGGSTGDWQVLPFGGDPNDDSGNPEADVVGDGTHSPLYYHFDDLGTPSLTDGTLSFRMRIGADNGPAGYRGLAVIGFDADLDDAIDLLIRVDFNPPGADEVQVRHVNGDGLTPATTTVSDTGVDVPATSANTNWSPVDATTDPTATNTDLDGDGTDHFISWSVDFSVVVQQLASLGIGGFDENSVVRMVAGTSTNASSSMNQDVVGVNGGADSTTSWTALGAITAPIVVPEPQTGALVGLGLVAIAAARRRRRRPRG